MQRTRDREDPGGRAATLAAMAVAVAVTVVAGVGVGHWARECRSKAKKEQAHFTQDEEAALMVVRATLTRRAAAVSGTDAAAAAPGGDDAGGVVAAVSDCGAVAAASGGDVETTLEIREEKVFVQLGQPEAGLDAMIWIINTGATNHMTGSRAAFIDLDTRVWGTVRFGDDSAAEIEGRGKVEFVCKNGERRVFGGVLYIPKLSANIISAGRLDEEGYQVVIGGGELLIREPGGKLLARVKRTASRLYLLTVKLSIAMCAVTCEDPVAWRWHERLGHLNFLALKKMVKEELVRGLPDIGPVERPCATCLAGKQRRTSFPAQAQYRAEKVLELVHDDLCGKITPPTPAGNQYFLLMVDDKSRFMSVVLLSSKNQAADAIKSFQLKAEPETGEKLGGLRTGRGGEFNSTSFLDYCLEQGV
jgi:hypothetical protein